ncbi:MAG: hypothetical protein QOE11_1235 [Solirubrobacteraceae bacterium]|jgi:hypothetical protein|nr:hypothetical protein [Solirubrobacteraceae bacterium]
MTDNLTEEHIARLIAALPPAPQSWVQAAQQLPSARAAIESASSRPTGQERTMKPPTPHDLDEITERIDGALLALCGADTEVQAHRMFTDERVKQSVDDMQGALALLRAPDTGGGERVNQSAGQLQRALGILRDISAKPETVGETAQAGYEQPLAQSIAELESALALLHAVDTSDIDPAP